MRRLGLVAAAFGAAGLGAQDEGVSAAANPAVYRVLVACESSDEVYHLAFDGEALCVDRRVQVGYQPTEIEGPHGLAVGLDGEHWYLSIAHGKPFGLVYKYRMADDELVGETEVGMFPATMEVSPATGLLYVANFNLHGRMLPSSVSVVDPDAMVEVERVTTGPMPHGSRVGVGGRKHYSCAMMSGHLFELDAVSMEVSRRLQLDEERPEAHESLVKPTWVDPHPDGKRAFVALNAAAQIAEVDLETWKVTRRLRTAPGPYNLEISPDGKHLVVSYKTDGSIGIWDLETNTQRAKLPSTRGVTHGVVITRDSRYAFVTSEGKGSQPGAVDVVDLDQATLTASIEIGLQAGGIALK